jgi:hypothetical protein
VKLRVKRKIGKGGVTRISFERGRPVLSTDVVRISKERREVALWEIEGGKMLRIEFDPRGGCPVTGFDLSDPSNVLSGAASDGAEIGREYSYSLVVQKLRAKEPVVIDPRMIIDL